MNCDHLETTYFSIGDTACPREVVARGGHLLEVIEYMIERVFLSFEPFEFGIFWNLHQPKGVPTPHFCQPTGFQGVPTPHFSST